MFLWSRWEIILWPQVIQGMLRPCAKDIVLGYHKMFKN